MKTEPLPGSLATVTSPPIIRASLRVMARPSPVPPNRWAVVASAWVNSSNSFACSAGSQAYASIGDGQLNPMAAVAYPSPAQRRLALLRELAGIAKRVEPDWRNRMGSTVRVPRSSCTSFSRRFLFCSASWRAVPTTSSIKGASCAVCGLTPACRLQSWRGRALG